MKKFGRHIGRTEQSRAAYDDALFDMEQENMNYTDDETIEEEEYDAAEYMDEEEIYEESAEYMAEEEVYEEASEYMEEEEVYEEAMEYMAEEEVCEEASEYMAEENTYEEPAEAGEYDEEELMGMWGMGEASKKKKPRVNLMDGVLVGMGIFALVLAVVIGVVYMKSKEASALTAVFATTGSQIEHIDVIGGKGLAAVADAQKAREEATLELKEQQKQEELEKEQEKDKEYNEIEYDKLVSVALNMTSVQKDLKIKFTNKETGKLIANAPFSVTVTKPDNKSEIWSDEDMDGIIYKKGIDSGDYKVAVNAFTEERYGDYVLPTGKQLVGVKKDISYKKVDVSAEVKKETESDAKVEDTKKNETVIESVLQDTVVWVESTSTANTYTEILKNKIPDPVTLGENSDCFVLTAYRSFITPSNYKARKGERFTVTVSCVDENSRAVRIQSVVWESSNPMVATVSGNGADAVVTTESAGNTIISYEAVVTDEMGNPMEPLFGTCSVTVEDAMRSIKVEKNRLTLTEGDKIQTRVLLSGFLDEGSILFRAESEDASIATADIQNDGMLIITGVGKGQTNVKVFANEPAMDGNAEVSADITVVVDNRKEIVLALPQLTVFAEVKAKVGAEIVNASGDEVLEAVSSDTLVATAEVRGKELIITGIKEGSATITVSIGDKTKTNCVITVKRHPKEDKETKLKDEKDNQLYVMENNTYREAVYADYYTAEKFFVKGDVKYTGWQIIDGKVYYFTAMGETVKGEQVIQGAKYTFASDGSLVTGSGTMGIDVSKWNGKVDWEAVKNSGVSYVIIRCGYRGSSNGELYEDRMFEENIKGATKAGLKVGVYFFTQATDEVEAVYEASFVLDRIKNYKISYPVFLDVEASGGRGDKIDKETRTAVCKAFCQTIQNAGYTAGIYANKTWLESKIDVEKLGAYKIWLAQYVKEPTYAGRIDLWQYTCKGKVGGISGDVDLNLSYLGY